MCSQTRNSCAKAFDNRSRSKNLKPKNRGGCQFDPLPPLKASRVKLLAESLNYVHMALTLTSAPNPGGYSLYSDDRDDRRIF